MLYTYVVCLWCCTEQERFFLLFLYHVWNFCLFKSFACKSKFTCKANLHIALKACLPFFIIKSYYTKSIVYLFNSNFAKNCLDSTICLFVCLFVCLIRVFPTPREFFTHMETSQLLVNGCKFWPVLCTYGHCSLFFK